MADRSGAAPSDRVYEPAQVVQTNQPEFSGTAAPGSVVRLLVGPAAKPWDTVVAGTTTANESGKWSLTTRHPLRNGQYRTVVHYLWSDQYKVLAGMESSSKDSLAWQMPVLIIAGAVILIGLFAFASVVFRMV